MNKRRIPKLYQLAVHYPKSALLLVCLITLLALFFVQKLKVESNLTNLLPQSAESVQSLQEFKNYFGGIGFLTVTVESPARSVSEKFAEKFSKEIETLSSVRYVDYHRPVQFFTDRQWLYVDVEDLKEIEHRIDHALELDKKGVSSTFNDLVDFGDKEDRPDLEFTDIREKYERKAGIDIKKENVSDDGKLIALQIKGKDYAENIDAGRKLILQIQNLEEKLKSENSDYSKIQVHYSGAYQKGIEDAHQTDHEIGIVSSVVAFLIIFILLVYFRGVGASFLIGIPLVIGVIWTGALLYLKFGHLSIITGFGAGILGGLGSDYGIYLLNRYYQEKEAGTDFYQACHLAFGCTGKATYASVITTVGCFAALLFSDFGVFVEFGMLGVFGIFMNYIAMMLVIPSLLVLIEKASLKNPIASLMKFRTYLNFSKSGFAHWFNALFIPKKALLTVFAVLILSIAAAFSIPKVSKIYFEDGQLNAKRKISNVGEEKANQVVQQTFKPTVLMVKGEENEKKLIHKIEEILKTTPAKESAYEKVLGFSSFVPENQLEKKEILKSIYQKFQKTTRVVKSGKELFLKSVKTSLQADWIHPENVPEYVKKIFQSFQDKNVYSIYLFPRNAFSSSENMRLLHDAVDTLKKETGISFIAADSNFIADDTIRLVESESPKGMYLILAFLSIVLLLVIRPLKRAAIILVNLLLSLVVTFGALWLFEIKLNVINISVIPIILGTGINCYIHLSHRFEESNDLLGTLKGWVPAIFVSNLTTLVGFGGLILTSNFSLRSIGWVAIIGLSIVTLFCLFVFPRCLKLETTMNNRSSLNIKEEIVV